MVRFMAKKPWWTRTFGREELHGDWASAKQRIDYALRLIGPAGVAAGRIQIMPSIDATRDEMSDLHALVSDHGRGLWPIF
jgi:hypothetical protein